MDQIVGALAVPTTKRGRAWGARPHAAPLRVVLPLLLFLLLAALIAGCGGSGSGSDPNPNKSFALGINWLALSTSRAQKVNALQSARSIEIRVEGSGGFTPVVGFVDRNAARNTAYTDSFTSPKLNLNSLGGPISFAQGAKFTLTVRAWTEAQGQGTKVGEIVLNNVVLKADGTGDNGTLEDGNGNPLPDISFAGGANKITNVTIPAAQVFFVGALKALVVNLQTATGGIVLPTGSVNVSATDPTLLTVERGQLRFKDGAAGKSVNLVATVDGVPSAAIPVTVQPRVNVLAITSPADTPLPASETRQFVAQDSNNNSVTWKASAGSISNTGLYTAPANAADGQKVTITAVSALESVVIADFIGYTSPTGATFPAGLVNAGQTVPKSITLTLTTARKITLYAVSEKGTVALPPLGGGAVSLPASATDAQGGVFLPSTFLIGAITNDRSRVRWSIDEPNGGTLSGDKSITPVTDGPPDAIFALQGITYTAPTRRGKFTLRATSLVNPNVSTTVTLDVQASDIPVILQ